MPWLTASPWYQKKAQFLKEIRLLTHYVLQVLRLILRLLQQDIVVLIRSLASRSCRSPGSRLSIKGLNTARGIIIVIGAKKLNAAIEKI